MVYKMLDAFHILELVKENPTNQQYQYLHNSASSLVVF